MAYSVIACRNTYCKSYDAIVIVTFEVLSDHMTFMKDIDIFVSCEFNQSRLISGLMW